MSNGFGRGAKGSRIIGRRGPAQGEVSCVTRLDRCSHRLLLFNGNCFPKFPREMMQGDERNRT